METGEILVVLVHNVNSSWSIGRPLTPWLGQSLVPRHALQSQAEYNDHGLDNPYLRLCAESIITDESKDVTAPISTGLFPERNVNCGLEIFRRDTHAISAIKDSLWSRISRDIDIQELTSLQNFIPADVEGNKEHQVACLCYKDWQIDTS